MDMGLRRCYHNVSKTREEGGGLGWGWAGLDWAGLGWLLGTLIILDPAWTAGLWLVAS